MRATRHNGRSGSHGVYNPKHNDREFDLNNNVDINPEMTPNNIYWNCYQGFIKHADKDETWMKFNDVELTYYKQQFSEWLDYQNEKHIKGGHQNRVKEMDAIVSNKQRCPEETIYQIGNMDETIDYEDLVKVVVETIDEINKRYGDNVTTLTWGLHVDEKTPHIHERHVFHSLNEAGFDMPVQEKTLEVMGFDLPDKTKPKDKFNNRKMSYDQECRNIFLDCCRKHGLEIELEPIYGGKKYLEKTEFINSKINLQNQNLIIENGQLMFANQELQAKQNELNKKISDEETLIKMVTDVAYEKACEVIVDDVVEKTQEENKKLVSNYKKWIKSDKCKASRKTKELMLDCFSDFNSKLTIIKSNVIAKVKDFISSPEKKAQLTEEIVRKARPSIVEILKRRNEEIALTKKAKTDRRKGKEQER